MATEVITREDLQIFRAQLLNELKELIFQLKADITSETVQGYKTKDVRKILDCSTNNCNRFVFPENFTEGKLEERSIERPTKCAD